MGIQRSFTRRQYFSAGEKPPKVLDSFNDEISTGSTSRILHATKGFRTTSMKRSRAAMVVAEQKQGLTPPTILVLPQIRMFILTGRYK
jgi:hypothetical protein